MNVPTNDAIKRGAGSSKCGAQDFPGVLDLVSGGVRAILQFIRKSLKRIDRGHARNGGDLSRSGMGAKGS
jgi:hypothetical protein